MFFFFFSKSNIRSISNNYAQAI